MLLSFGKIKIIFTTYVMKKKKKEKKKKIKHGLKLKKDVFRSTVKNSNSRGIYLDFNSSKEIFISKKYSCFSLAGDIVECVLFSKKRNKSEGKVVSVVKRVKNTFVGQIDSSSNSFFIADNKNVYFDVFLNDVRASKKITPNKKILVRVDLWDSNYKNPFGSVFSVLGDADDHKTISDSILYTNGFSPYIKKSPLDLAKNITETIDKKEASSREDFRNISTFTIDPKDAKDFDDALSVRKIKPSLFQIGVHIADVSHYVVANDAIDQEALKRGTSVYLSNRVVPMLPEKLSNNICSLKPGVDRLAFSVVFLMNSKAEVVDYEIKKTIIYSDYRFTYEEAQDIINSKKGLFYDDLSLLNSLAKKLRKKRLSNGSINFESSDVNFVFDKKNNPIDVSVKASLDSNKLIEEFMLLANKTVAKHMQKQNLPFIYRTHSSPEKDDFSFLVNACKVLDIDFKNSSGNISSKDINSLLFNVSNSNKKTVEILLSMIMKKALYTTKSIGHYGLSFDFYSHFTSPIRRYPDLIVHRLLKNPSSYSLSSLENICSYCSNQEKKAVKAERESNKYIQTKYLKNKIGEVYTGFITGVTDWGLYVEIILGCEGLIKISSLSGDHYIYDKKNLALIGYHSKNCYQLGQEVAVKIKTVDLNIKQAYFELV